MPKTAPITYVLDTSVLLADPNALHKFEEHDVVIPLVVINELEGKRDHPELGWFARQALRNLEELRIAHGAMTKPMPVNDDGGTVRVEVNHQDRSGLPEAFRGDTNDHRILAVAHQINDPGKTAAVVVSKDLPLRLKAGVVGLEAEQYLREQATDSSYTGTARLPLPGQVIDKLFADGTVVIDANDSHASLRKLFDKIDVNTNLIIKNATQSGLARVTSRTKDTLSAHRVRQNETFGLCPRSAEQMFAMDMLNDPKLGVISLGGPAGTGKSIMAIAAGLEAVLERRDHKKIVVFRPLYSVGGQDLGFLPGDETEKMGPWQRAVFDALETFCSAALVEEVIARKLLEILPLTHIRGRTLTDSFVIVDEAQNLERSVLLAALSRLGERSRVVLTHDVAQRDNLHVGRHDGVLAVVERLSGNPLFGHIALTKSERSPIAAMVTELLDD